MYIIEIHALEDGPIWDQNTSTQKENEFSNHDDVLAR
jgi:hypothetical protein